MSKSLLKIEDSPDLLKDIESGAVLNTNVNALRAYKAKKTHSSNLENKVNSMEKELKEIKELLLAVLTTSSEKR
jgi:hypothetical protein